MVAAWLRPGGCGVAVDDGAQGDRLSPFNLADFSAKGVCADLQPRMLGEYDVQRFVDQPDGTAWPAVLTRCDKRPGGYVCFTPEEQWPVRMLDRREELRQQAWVPFQHDEEHRVSEVVAIADDGAVGLS